MIKVSIRNEKSRNKKRPIKRRRHPALVNHTFVVLLKCSHFPKKWRGCAFWQYKGSCGNSRGKTELVRLGDCNDPVVNHLTSCHLSREKMTEHELILARAGAFELPPSKAGKMFICPKHRHSLGKYWKQRRPCQYPTHRGGKKAIKSSDVINVRMAKEIMKLHGVIVPTGSGW